MKLLEALELLRQDNHHVHIGKSIYEGPFLEWVLTLDYGVNLKTRVFRSISKEEINQCYLYRRANRLPNRDAMLYRLNDHAILDASTVYPMRVNPSNHQSCNVNFAIPESVKHQNPCSGVCDPKTTLLWQKSRLFKNMHSMKGQSSSLSLSSFSLSSPSSSELESNSISS